MIKFFLHFVGSCGFLLLATTLPAQPDVTTIFLVRHADSDGVADALTPEGLARAQELARVLGDTGISVIYTSDRQRTRQTAYPLTSLLNLDMIEYDPSDLPSLVNNLLTKQRGEIILVTGHSNTVPQTINLLGVTPPLPDIPHDAYDHLYIVTLVDDQAPVLLKSRYGE